MAIFMQKKHINYSCTHMLVHMLAPPRKLGKCGAVWCSLVRFGVYFDQSVS